MSNLAEGGEIDYRDFLARADMLAAAGKTVLVSDYSEYYRLTGYLRRHTQRPIGIVLGAGSLATLFDEKYYANLDGGILESFGRLLKYDTRLYVYPLLDRASGHLMTAENLVITPELDKLYGYLGDRGCIVPLKGYQANYLSIFSREVLARIRQGGDASWEEAVPPEIAEVIKRRGFFGYRRGDHSANG